MLDLSHVPLTVSAQAAQLRRVAEAGPIGKRYSSFELYDLLAKCSALASRCAAGDANRELRALVAAGHARGRNRVYAERGSDEFSLVCRYVFGDLRSASASAERSNASRYAAALRQARRIGVTAEALAKYLKERGGVNSLFLARPVSARSVRTRLLYLTDSVEIPKTGRVKITIERAANGRFSVVALEADNA